MHKIYGSNQSSQRSVYNILCVAFFWLAGLIGGFILALQCNSCDFDILFRSVLNARLCISSVILVFMLPFVFSAIAVYTENRWLLITTVFFKGFFLAFVSFLISFSFDSAGWLIALLVMTPNILSSAVFLLYAIRMQMPSGHLSFSDHISYILCALLFIVLYFVTLLPFSQMLSQYV